MYCSSCGAAVAQGLTYCSRCGAKSVGREHGGVTESPGPKPETLVAAMVFVFFLGLIGIAGLMSFMRSLPGFDFGRIMAVMLLSFLIMLLVEGVFAWLLLRRRSVAKEAGAAGLPNQQTTSELDAAQARALPEPAPSVTEHTTRKFEPIYVERKSE